MFWFRKRRRRNCVIFELLQCTGVLYVENSVCCLKTNLYLKLKAITLFKMYKLLLTLILKYEMWK